MSSFSQSCLDNHACFRVLLQAMSRPGTIYQLPAISQGDFESSLIRLLDTVLDQQSSCHLVQSDPALEQKIKDHTGTHFTAAESADFILALSGNSQGKVCTAKRGRLDFPDQGATMVFGVKHLESGSQKNGLRLSGPGVKDVIHPGIEGLDKQELVWLKEANSEFPLGVDSIFLDQSSQLMCIPRSTRIGV